MSNKVRERGRDDYVKDSTKEKMNTKTDVLRERKKMKVQKERVDLPFIRVQSF